MIRKRKIKFFRNSPQKEFYGLEIIVAATLWLQQTFAANDDKCDFIKR